MMGSANGGERWLSGSFGSAECRGVRFARAHNVVRLAVPGHSTPLAQARGFGTLPPRPNFSLFYRRGIIVSRRPDEFVRLAPILRCAHVKYSGFPCLLKTLDALIVSAS